MKINTPHSPLQTVQGTTESNFPWSMKYLFGCISASIRGIP